MYASLYKGSDWDNENREIDRLLTSPALVDIDTVKMQTEEKIHPQSQNRDNEMVNQMHNEIHKAELQISSRKQTFGT